MNGDVRREWFEKDFHPDRNAGNKAAEDKFKEISAANDVLGDEDKRKQYDQVREMAASGFGGGSVGGFPGGAPGGGRVRFEDFDIGDLGDLFGGLFGGSGRPRARANAARGADLETRVTVSFDESMSGVTVPGRIDGPAPCETCGGSGAAPGTTPVTCPQCGGFRQNAGEPGVFPMSPTSPRRPRAGRIVE